jgi:hypothetical protein
MIVISSVDVSGTSSNIGILGSGSGSGSSGGGTNDATVVEDVDSVGVMSIEAVLGVILLLILDGIVCCGGDGNV